MAYLNANIPTITCFIRNEFLFNFERGQNEYTAADVHSVASIQKRTPLFEAFLENGVNWTRRPIHAFCWKTNAETLPLTEHVYWDCFSSYIDVQVRERLSGLRADLISITGVKRQGVYMFTLDWSEGDFNELDFGYASKPDQHKCGHVIQMDNGNFAIQPNNRMRVFDSNMGVNWSEPPLINRLVNTRVWSVEDEPKWTTTETEIGQYNYEYKNTEKK